MTIRIPDDYKSFEKIARAHGWTVGIWHNGKSGHLAWTSPEGKTVFSPSSPSDRRGVHRVRSKLRRAGLPV